MTINALFYEGGLTVLPKKHFIHLGWFYFNYDCSFTLKLTFPSSSSPPHPSNLQAAKVSCGLGASAHARTHTLHEKLSDAALLGPQSLSNSSKAAPGLRWTVFTPCVALRPPGSASTLFPCSPDSLVRSGRVGPGREGQAAPLGPRGCGEEPMGPVRLA